MKTKRIYSLGFAAVLAAHAVVGFSSCSNDGWGNSGNAPSSFQGAWTGLTYVNEEDGATSTTTLTIKDSSNWDAGTGDWGYYAYYDNRNTCIFTELQAKMAKARPDMDTAS